LVEWGNMLKILALLSNFGVLIYVLFLSTEGFLPLEGGYFYIYLLFFVLPLINIFALFPNKKMLKLKTALKIIAVLLNLGILVLGMAGSLANTDLLSPTPIMLFLGMYLFLLINIFALFKDKEVAVDNKPALFFERMKDFLRFSRKKLILTIIIALIIIFLPFLFTEPPILNFPADTWMMVGGCYEELCWDGLAVNYIALAFNVWAYLMVSYPIACFLTWVSKKRKQINKH